MVKEHKRSFQLIIQADSSFEQAGDAYVLKVDIKAFRKFAGGAHPIGEMITSKVTVPVPTFKDEDQANLWADQTFRSFRAGSTKALLEEAALTLGDEANGMIGELGIEQMNFHELVSTHVQATRDRVRDRFNIPSEGQPSPWIKDELAAAVVSVLNALPAKERNYSKVSEELKKSYGEKAPESAEALRKLLSRFNLNWKKLKTGQYFIKTLSPIRNAS